MVDWPYADPKRRDEMYRERKDLIARQGERQ